jgi:TPR repeat protein
LADSFSILRAEKVSHESSLSFRFFVSKLPESTAFTLPDSFMACGVRKLFARLVLVFLLTHCHAHAKYTGSDAAVTRPVDILSTNWLAAARAALPSEYWTKNLTFQETTNLLCQESRRGNNAAQGLWGFVLLVQSRGRDEGKIGLQLLRDSAEKGFVPVMLQLGFLFESRNQYVEQDHNEAFRWFSLAAAKGNSEGEFHLGRCYHYGWGTTQDFSRAAKYYRRAAEQTNYVAMKSLGYLLMNGFGAEKDLQAARYWSLRAAKEGGNRRAMNNLSALCILQSSDTNSMAEAFQWCKQSAELDDPLACHSLAVFYLNGLGGVATNIDSYRYWLSKAATLGSTEAQFFMGEAYRRGDGVPMDAERSLMWYRKAAAKNHPMAMYNLAVHYWTERTNRASMELANDYMLRAAQGGHLEAQFQCAMNCFRDDIAPPDCEGGKRWLASSAESGWARAEFVLSQLYYHGAAPSRTCPQYPKDVPQAINWLRRAAEHGSLEAQPFWAVMLIQGKEVERNTTEAEKLLRSAAQHGYAPAQNDLGFSILNGDTAKMDLVEAAMWCRLAQSGTKDPNVLRRIEVNISNIVSKLSLNQRVEVGRRVEDFRAVPRADPDPMIKDWESNPAYQQEDGQLGH